jgi:hypothetical protein
MKKSIFLLSLVASLALTACNGGASTEATGTDSTSVVVDSTLAVDSTAVIADSVKADTTVK